MEIQLVWVIALTVVSLTRGFTIEFAQTDESAPRRRDLGFRAPFAGARRALDTEGATRKGGPLTGQPTSSEAREAERPSAVQTPKVARRRREVNAAYAERVGDELLIHGHKVMTEHKTRERLEKETARNTVMLVCFSIMGFCVICTAFTVKKLCSYE